MYKYLKPLRFDVSWFLAKNAVECGLRVAPTVKTSLAPGSKVVTGYLRNSGLQTYLDTLGFNISRLWLYDMYR